MADLPASKMSPNVFTVSFDGSYGRFTTGNSFQLEYLQTSAKLRQLEYLETASEAFPFQNISFDELIQRDIDYERVDQEIVPYLATVSDRVVFFPPILASFVALDDSGIISQYETHTCRVEGKDLIYVWDEDRFLLELPLSNSPTGYVAECNGSDHNYFPYAATVKYNPERVKLVVIDGQHRFKAIQRVAADKEKKTLLKNLEIPLCIFFTPGAVKGQSDEDILVGLRQLFVTINQKQRLVSGHFLTLLDDESLASLSVRLLADEWKAKEFGKSRLPFLEWNTRDKRKAGQQTKPYSITTVTILSDALKQVFARKPGRAPVLLNLTSREADLECDGCPTYDEICEDNFSSKQVQVLRKQIKDYLVPALNVLFLEAGPYVRQVDRVRSALEWLEKEIENNNHAALAYRDDVFRQFRKVSNNDGSSVLALEEQFEHKLVEGMQDEGEELFFRNVFQQGWIRAWAELCFELVPAYGLRPVAIAKALAAAAEILVFHPKKQFCENRMPYVQKVLYDGERIIVNATSRDGWKRLILTSLANRNANRTFLESLANDLDSDQLENFTNDLKKNVEDSTRSYIETLESRSIRDLGDNYHFRDLGQSTVLELDKLKLRNLKKFSERIEKLASEKINDAITKLSNLLDVPVVTLRPDV